MDTTKKVIRKEVVRLSLKLQHHKKDILSGVIV